VTIKIYGIKSELGHNTISSFLSIKLDMLWRFHSITPVKTRMIHNLSEVYQDTIWTTFKQMSIN